MSISSNPALLFIYLFSLKILKKIKKAIFLHIILHASFHVLPPNAQTVTLMLKLTALKHLDHYVCSWIKQTLKSCSQLTVTHLLLCTATHLLNAVSKEVFIPRKDQLKQTSCALLCICPGNCSLGFLEQYAEGLALLVRTSFLFWYLETPWTYSFTQSVKDNLCRKTLIGAYLFSHRFVAL